MAKKPAKGGLSLYKYREWLKQAIADGEKFLELAPNYPQANEMRKAIAEWRGKLK